ncbi:MAG: transketolase C-terminal domain-containing protein [Eubacteriales bacterium]|jgi:transketolase|nr:transketolase C-terminal domain-containing protein [Eubacteriales bacterium]MDD3110574.1 transketolase C-terminal domain-containing protein [Eubacteriales bacterium]MDD3571980.1 transketolase C-terminal domain-containing protein [Eubacteriales bacterium]MDD4133602.1 transketolase C-terminal domain-containing protein [Eubacteriales bacterium]NLO14218.1 transketolase family protein [Clostridiales bacterium]
MPKIVYDGSNDPRTFKDVIGSTIISLLDNDPDVIYVDADLMSTIGTYKYHQEHPDRAINVGVSEANMMGVAGGLAAAGFKPIAHTFGPFASRRSYDQVFLSAGYAHNDITVIGTDPGVCAAFNGGTHMPFEDVALYRAIPTATIFDVTDTVMLEDILRQAVNLPGVKYIRVGRKSAAKVYDTGSRFQVGQAVKLRDGKDISIISAGIMVHEALQAAETLAKEGIEADVLDMFTIKPLDESALLESAHKTRAVLAAENHSKNGGLYAAVCETLSRELPTRANFVAVDDEYGEVGPQDYLQERYGLTADAIVARARELVNNKK